MKEVLLVPKINRIHSDKKLKSVEIFYIIFSCVLLVTGIILYVLNPASSVLWIYASVFVALSVFVHRNNPPLLILFLYIFSFTFVPYYFFVLGMQFSPRAEFNAAHLINKAVLVNFLFLFFLSLPLLGLKKSMLVDARLWQRGSLKIFSFFFLLGTFIILYSNSSATVFSEGYGVSENSKNAIHEYFIIAFLLLKLFQNQVSKIQQRLVILMLFAYSLTTFVHGGRIEVLQILLLYSYVEFAYLKNFSKRRIAAILLGGFLVLSLIGFARSDPLNFISRIHSFDDLLNLYFNISKRDYVFTTEGDVMHASARMLGLIEAGILPLNIRILSFVAFVFNIFAPSSFWPDYANLASYKTSVYSSGGGGLIGAYSYVWLGYLGPICAGIFVGSMIRNLYISKSLFLNIYALLVLISFPRWYSYNPVTLVKFCVVGVIVYLVSYACCRTEL